VRLYGVVVVLGRWVRGCARLLCGHEVPPRGPGPGERQLLRGHSFIRRPYLTTYVVLCQLLLYNIRVEFLTVEVNVDKLQELRINRGLSQRRLADLAGVSNTSVWKIEQGGGANPATLKKLADVLEVRPVDLLKQSR
jgi:DNA-binding XRE family transcriptional regulator